jgi:LmbE family N-acetylglucosaminyl deacetylase
MRGVTDIPLGDYATPELPPADPEKPGVVILSAHPDDEILNGMPLGIRFKLAGSQLTNIAVTIGRPGQSERRLGELHGACKHLGIDLIIPAEHGFRELIKANTAEGWDTAVNALADVLRKLHPKVVITHHEDDAHHDHIATNRLTVAAMEQIRDLDCLFVVGEYWKDMTRPNLQLEIGADNFVFLLEALSFHKGELARNRYDTFWLPHAHVNARYGEVITGWGAPAAEFDFSVMYRVRRFRSGKFEDYLKPLQLAAGKPITSIFPMDWR